MAPPASIITCPNCGKRNRVRPEAEGVPRCGNCRNPLPWLVDAGPQGFEAELRASVPVLVDFWAPWCGPCKWIAPLVEALARKHSGRMKVVRLNVDAAPEISARFDLRGIPTLVVIRDGEEVDRLAGAPQRPQLEAWVDRHVGTQASAGNV
jgi:thioredoxin 2